ncbi:MAG: hypothetical protein ACYC35_26275 [Pirellulales bacterium]
MSELADESIEPTGRASVPARRVVLLGASNLTRGISTVVETARRVWGRPLEMLVAMGHGRSYGWGSWFLGRRLPGIVDCGLWRALADRPALPTAALVTDIGNDLIYEAPLEDVVAWVETCLDRLSRAEARVVMTLLPTCNLAKLSPWRFRLFRTLFFPKSRLPLETLVERASELNDRVRRLGESRQITLVQPQAEWYGLDPIHVRRGSWPAVWHEILSAWHDGAGRAEAYSASLARCLYLRLLPPEERRFLGREQRRPQPAGRLPDGSTMAVY